MFAGPVIRVHHDPVCPPRSRHGGVPRPRASRRCLLPSLGSRPTLGARRDVSSDRLGALGEKATRTLTGVAEAAGALGLLLPATAPLAAGGLILLLLAVFPANVHAARAAVGIGGRSATPLALRGLLQLAFIAAVLAAGFAS